MLELLQDLPRSILLNQDPPAATMPKKRKTSESSESSRSRNSSQAAILGTELNDLVKTDDKLTMIIREKKLIHDQELQRLIKSAYWNKAKSELLHEEPEKVQLFAERINKFIKQRIDNNLSSARSRKKKEEKLADFESQVKVLQSEKSVCQDIIQTLRAELEKVKCENMRLKSQVERLSLGQADRTLVEVNESINDKEFNEILANEVLKEGDMLRDLNAELGEGGVAALREETVWDSRFWNQDLFEVIPDFLNETNA